MIITDDLFACKVEENLTNEERFVVGLSGGADSLCLTLLANVYAKLHNKKLFACIVDHRLREESSTEILPTIDILHHHDIQHKVCVWHHDGDITGNIEKKARDVRYAFLKDYCTEIGSRVLMTAHHALDQWETFFMRLSRGASLRGLSSIKPKTTVDGIILLRPMLEYLPADIKETLRERFGITSYVNDPSNKQTIFERVKWRTSYDDLSNKYSLSISNVNKTVDRLRKANDCINAIVTKELQEVFDGNYIFIRKFKLLHWEIRIRVLDMVIHMVSTKGDHIISYGLLEKVANEICGKEFVACNLFGVVLRRDRTKNVRVSLENRS